MHSVVTTKLLRHVILLLFLFYVGMKLENLDSAIAFCIHWHFINGFVRFIYIVFSFKFVPRVPWEIHRNSIVLLSVGGCSPTFVSKYYMS